MPEEGMSAAAAAVGVVTDRTMEIPKTGARPAGTASDLRPDTRSFGASAVATSTTMTGGRERWLPAPRPARANRWAVTMADARVLRYQVIARGRPDKGVGRWNASSIKPRHAG